MYNRRVFSHLKSSTEFDGVGAPINLKDFALSSYDFAYPEELLATEPCAVRDDCRLLVFNRASSEVSHARFRDLGGYLKSGDCLVINETKVLSCRLIGKKASGGKAEFLLVREISSGLWAALGSGFKKGQEFFFSGDLKAQIQDLNSEGEYLLRFDREDILEYMEREGFPPLPPYIVKKRKSVLTPPSGKEKDSLFYQTVYAENAGSIAAPTAGLHFTSELLSSLEKLGIRICRLTLHVGRGTFKSIVSEDIRSHTMLPEYFHIDDKNLLKLKETQKKSGRVIAVGTTATRTLETLAARGFISASSCDTQDVSQVSGLADLFICPGYEFKAVSALITNFHLPKSTPLILASAMLGREKLLDLYKEAFALRYHLFSYGDAMLII